MKDIEQILRDNVPQTPDEGQFLIETNARLREVEGIRKAVEEERRRSRISLTVVLTAGLLAGCLLTSLLMLDPFRGLASVWPTLSQALEKSGYVKEILLIPIAGCAITLGIGLMTRKDTSM